MTQRYDGPSQTLYFCSLLVALSSCGGQVSHNGDTPRADASFVFVDSQAPPVAPAETCNGFDDDLDGEVDEGCSCTAGMTQICFPGPPQEMVGPCKQGVQHCEGGGEFKRWGECVAATPPTEEICDDGVDQDCDGADAPCMPQCGDGQCNAAETCTTCPADCGACPPGCGDGQCGGAEDCAICPDDCGICPTTCEQFTFGASSRATDIVWVIDQSTSMSDDIAMVKSKLNQFSSFIGQSGIDYHVVMLAKKGTDKYGICIPSPLGGASCGDASRFTHVDEPINSHDALMKITWRIKDIEAALRKDSLRHFVIVSDDDSTEMPAAAFEAFLAGRPGYKDYYLHGVVGLKAGDCVAAVGSVYQELAKNSGGSLFHLCNADWTALFQQLSTSLTNIAQTHFKLTRAPRANSVVVTYGGVPAREGVDWDLDPVGGQVVLKGTLPAAGEAVEVCYQYVP